MNGVCSPVVCGFQHKSCQICRVVCKPEVDPRSWVHRQRLGIGTHDIWEKEKVVGILNCRSVKTGEWLAGSVDRSLANTDPPTAIPRIEIALMCQRPAKEYRQQTNANSEVIGRCDEISCPAYAAGSIAAMDWVGGFNVEVHVSLN
jgi:hypothetical protein